MTELLTAKEVAALLAVAVSTVDRMAREGQIASIRVGSRSRRYHEADVRDFIEGRRTYAR